MAKPIFLIGLPIRAEDADVRRVHDDLNTKMGDEYHVLVYRAQEINGLKFEVLNAINATDVEIHELIEKTRKEIEDLTLKK